jgi:ATP-dependent RNA helicase RhlE
MSFGNLGLNKPLLEILEKKNFKAPYPIQEKAIPGIIRGKDVLGIAQTGSGKTASYVLPILSSIAIKKGPKNRKIDVLVLVPTRELAQQVKEVFTVFEKGSLSPIKTIAVYGGVSINPQMKSLYGVSILVATPGRLLDLADSNAVHFNNVRTLVLDEADKLLNLGFKDEMNRIFSLLPAKRQNLLFSATLNEKVEEINQIILKNPSVVNTTTKEDNLDKITQLSYSISKEKKGPFLRYLIKKGNLKQVLVFTASTYQADNVANKLRKNGIVAKAIHGKNSQQSRKNALQDFKEGRLRVLVATDLLARGIDIEDLPYVINYELPRSPKDYIHRIGRTGRAESKGDSITLVSPEDEHHFKIIQKKMKISVERLDGNDKVK